MKRVHPPAKNPCGSCPYRCDVPSGVWDEEEYAKLPLFDKETFDQPPSVFLCHQQDGRLCAGWTAVHNMEESFGLRMAFSMGMIDPTDADAIFDYSTDVPLFASGADAAAHGRAEIDAPGAKASRTIQRLVGKVSVLTRLPNANLQSECSRCGERYPRMYQTAEGIIVCRSLDECRKPFNAASLQRH